MFGETFPRAGQSGRDEDQREGAAETGNCKDALWMIMRRIV